MRIHKPSTWFRKGRTSKGCGNWPVIYTLEDRSFDEIFRWKSRSHQQKQTNKKTHRKTTQTYILGFIFLVIFTDYNHATSPWTTTIIWDVKVKLFPQALPRRGATPKNCNHLFSGAAACLLLYGFGWIQSMKHTRGWHLSSVVTSVSEGLLWWLS